VHCPYGYDFGYGSGITNEIESSYYLSNNATIDAGRINERLRYGNGNNGNQ
jgi:hypothetical protein